MVIMRTENDVFHAKITKDELIMIGNCLNEVCHGMDLFEFETRVGASKEETCRVLEQILAAQHGS
jgi:hypothetical protein